MMTERCGGKNACHPSYASFPPLSPLPTGSQHLLASGSRDRLIHIFDLSRSRLELLQTLDDHSSSITGVQFSHGSSKFMSCSADKSIIFREMDVCVFCLPFTVMWFMELKWGAGHDSTHACMEFHGGKLPPPFCRPTACDSSIREIPPVGGEPWHHL